VAQNVNPVTGTITDFLNNAWDYTVGNCTRFVAGAVSWIPAGLGNATDWLSNAQVRGLPTIGPTETPPVGSVAVWGTGAFGHVAEVVGQVPGGFKVAEENWKGLGVTDVRDVTGDALNGLKGFILPPGTTAQVPAPPGQAQAVTVAGAVSELPASVGHGLANAATAGIDNVGIWLGNQLVPLIVALAVAIVLFGGDESRSSSQ
jgi:hypothetical protein